MRHNAKEREKEREAIDKGEEELRAYNEVYQSCDELLRKDRVLLDQLRKVV
jgi:hypothetical protein